jgi:hypothetical protein
MKLEKKQHLIYRDLNIKNPLLTLSLYYCNIVNEGLL